MLSEAQENQILSRRIFLLGGLGLTTFGILSSRLYYLQVTKAQDYTVLSENNRFNYNIIIPSRGRILDRSGEALAINSQDYRLTLIAEQVQDVDATLDTITDIVPLSDKNRKRIKNDIRRHAKFVPVLIEDHLQWEQFAALNLRTPEIPGLVPQAGEGRAYPNEGIFSHVLGFVGSAGPEDVEKDDDPLLRQPTFRMGKTGVEAAVDKHLRGKSGRLKVEVNAMGRIVREWPEKENQAAPGKDVWLTLDASLQRYAAELYEEDSGGVAVIDVMTGELRVLLSMPTFDGNLFVSGLTQKDMDRMNADEQRPQFNKVIGGGYPPASTFKMSVMLATLKNRAANPKERVICTGKVKVGNRTFHCWKRRGHGPVNLSDALKHSCDLYFYEMGQRLGINAIAEVATQLGLGQKFDLGVAGQTSGIVPTTEWKQKRLGQGWRMGDTLNASIGQGFVLATPLQLAVMAARIANGAKAVTPHLIIGDKVPVFDDLGINQDHMAMIQQAMWRVTSEPGGTAYRHNALGFKGIEMAGKTGTGQVRGISASERASGVLHNRELPWKLRDHSIFVGYAPFDKPRFAIGTIVEHGGSGSKRAAHITRELLKRVLKNDGIPELLEREALP